MPASPASPGSNIPLARILSGISSPVRWSILKELAKGEPLPSAELARRLGMGDSAMSKQMAVMRHCGMVVTRYGHYALPGGVLSDDGKTADYGCVVLRLDRS
jgi:DNA-binding transcriptional ArsR family regulator